MKSVISNQSVLKQDGASINRYGFNSDGADSVRQSLEVCLTESVYKVVCNNQFPHKSVNLSFIITDIKNRLTDLYRN